jgi:flagellar basal body-associated protein FliL
MEGVMSATHLPPNPYLDSRNYRASHDFDHERNARAVVAILLAFLGLLALAAAAGAVVLLPHWLEQQRIEARMGPKMNLYTLPDLNVAMGGGSLSVDVTLKVQLDKGVKGSKLDPYVDRITDRLGDRIRDAGLERLQGADGAKLMKEMARSVVQQEVRGVHVKDVLIDYFAVRSPYSMLSPVAQPAVG